MVQHTESKKEINVDEVSQTLENVGKKNIFLVVLLVLLVFAGAFLYVFFPEQADDSTRTRATARKKDDAIKPVPVFLDYGLVKHNLGGTRGQAEKLYALVKATPGKNEYFIMFSGGNVATVFGCNFEEAIIYRKHTLPSGHGSMERWVGHVLDRLKNASSGGSIDETPDGRRVSETDSF